MKSVHYVSINYHYKGGLDYGKFVINLNHIAKTEKELIDSLKKELMKTDLHTFKKVNIPNYEVSGITLLNDMLIGDFTLDDHEGGPYINCDVKIGIYDEINNFLYIHEPVQILNLKQ